MDKRFEEWVEEEVRTHPDMVTLDKLIANLYAMYKGSEKGWNLSDAAMLSDLKHRRLTAEMSARNLAWAFWMQVKPGRVFVHRRYITVDRQPERCVITKLEYCRHGSLFLVYYRTADGSGMRTKAEPMYFRRQSFGEWV